MIYTPDSNFNGQDYLIYEVCNTLLFPCTTDTVFFTVTPVNDTPLVFLPGTTTPTNEVSSSTLEEEPVTFCFDFFDFDGDLVSISSWNLPNPNGIVIDTLTDSICITYLPNENFNGIDMVQVVFCDDNVSSACDTINWNIEVIPVNDNPVVYEPGTTTIIDQDLISTPEDTPVTYCFEFFDIDGDTVSLSGWNMLSFNGFVIDTLTDSICITYMPTPNFNGLDSIEVYFCDNQANPLCDTFLLYINVIPVNDGPQVLEPGTSNPTNVILTSTPEDSLLHFCFEFYDADNDSVSISGWNLFFSNGIIIDTLSDSICISYLPNLNFNGLDSIEVYFCDNGTNPLCDTLLFIVDVIPVNDDPVIIDPVSQLPADTLWENATSSIPQIICIEVMDADSDLIDIQNMSFLSGTGNGTLTLAPLNDSCFIYTSDTLFSGIDTIQVVISDGTSTDTAIVVVNVVPYNNMPYVIYLGDSTSTFMRDTTNEEVPLTICLDFFDFDNHQVSIDSVYSTTGSATISDTSNSASPCFTYQPHQGIVGSDTVEVIICDNGSPVQCTTIQVFIEILEENDAPEIQYINSYVAGDTLWLQTNEDTPLNLCFDVFDEENNNLFFQEEGSLSISENGTLFPTSNPNDTCILFVPNTNFTGFDTLIVIICDDGTPSLCDQIILIIEVLPVNDPPIANDIVATVYLDQPRLVILKDNVYDVDDDLANLTFDIVTPAMYGTISLTDGIIEYMPDQGYIGVDTIVYKVCDDDSLCNDAVIWLTIDYDIFIPNGFSPNNDGINDYFEILGLNNFTDEFDDPYPNSMKIFNRWGKLVFSVDDYDNENSNRRWEGQSNTSVKRTVKGNKLPPGTYYYIFTIPTANLRKSSFVILAY